MNRNLKTSLEGNIFTDKCENFNSNGFFDSIINSKKTATEINAIENYFTNQSAFDYLGRHNQQSENVLIKDQYVRYKTVNMQAIVNISTCENKLKPTLKRVHYKRSRKISIGDIAHILQPKNNQEIKITAILDTSTCRSDGAITPGRNLEIKGNNIKITDADTNCGIFFVHKATKEILKLNHTDIVLNEATRLLIFIPTNMKQEEYELKISTKYSGTTQNLLQIRSTTFALALKPIL